MENLLKKITGIKLETPNRWNIPAPTNLRFVNPAAVYMISKSMCVKNSVAGNYSKCKHITLTIS